MACVNHVTGGIACYAFIIKKEENTIYSEYGLAAHATDFDLKALSNL
jgi:hypothetical protein